MRRPASAVLAAIVLLAGCSGGDDPAPRIAPSDSTSAASTTAPPTPTGPVEPTLPPEAEGEDAAAAEAFVRHFWAMVNYAQATGDVGGLARLGADTCAACQSGYEWIERVHRQGGRVDGGQITVSDSEVRPLFAGDEALFEVIATVVTTDQVVTGTRNLDRTYPGNTSRITFFLTPPPVGWVVQRWEAS